MAEPRIDGGAASGGSGGAARVQALPSPPGAGGGVAAVGPAGREGVFVAHVPGIGLRYLDLFAEPPGRWSTAGGFSGAISGQFGLHHEHGSGATACVSFVESPPRSWACLRIPAVGEHMSVDEAALVERTTLSSDVVAACRAEGPDGGDRGSEAAVALAGGAVRFFDLATGKAFGKGLKLEPPSAADAAVRIVGLARGRVAVVRQDTSRGCEFFIVELQAEAGGGARKAVLHSRGALTGAVPAGRLSGAAAVESEEQDRLLLCWGPAEGQKKAPRAFASAVLGDRAALAPLGGGGGTAAAAAAAPWLLVGGYLVECAAAAGKQALALAARDARFGMPAASCEVPLASDGSGLLAATAGGVSLLVSTKGSEVAAVRWVLPKFTLQLVIGASEAQAVGKASASGGAASLAPLRDAAAGKRARDDPAVEELLAAKRRAVTDEAMAKEVKRRLWPATHEFVDLVAKGKCWQSARALLGLPELGEDLSVRLLAADASLEASLLAHVVRRASTPQLLEAALSDHLPPALLPALIEVLLEWMDAYRDYPHTAIQEAVPGLPTQAEVIRFLSALAGGCLPSLLRLEGDLLERVTEALSFAHKDRTRSDKTHAGVRAALRAGDAIAGTGKRAAREAPAIEAMLVDF